MPKIRSPICTLVGHVDHGKTTLLDSIRGTTLAEREPGRITQHIGATEVPLSTIKKLCGKLIDSLKIDLTIPGLLFLDTPGHKAFVSLRKRGGNLADIAILVIDVLEGIKPQTLESIEILKNSKTPFVIALTKIDLISGFKDNKTSLLQNIESQADNVKKELDTKLYTIVGELYEKFQLNAERFDRVDNYTQKIAIIPISSKLKVGLPELLMVLTGLTQKYLENKLKIDIKGPAKATILEVKEAPGLGISIDVIIYDGTIKVDDTILIGSLENPIKTKVRSLLKLAPLSEIRDKKSKFSKVDEVTAAAGVKITAPGLDNVLSGMPLRVVGKDFKKAEREIKEEIEDVIIETEKDGIIVKADTLGSLEALDNILKERNLIIKKASLGNITKSDIAEASSSQNPLNRVVLGFNVKSDEDSKDIKVITNEVIYKILEDYDKWSEHENKRLKKEKLSKLRALCKIQIMPGFVFRQNNPAVVGVEILLGKLKPNTPLMLNGKEITSAKSLQLEGENIEEAEKGKQVAVSLPGV
ncbi:MAG TPA: translation initiation factor IF-2, partial [Candidatus Nanoarchaeia archaeon]|nr:translation initiation factor IF-2 [Candidatus Nanoarchaeia archaeon]